MAVAVVGMLCGAVPRVTAGQTAAESRPGAVPETNVGSIVPFLEPTEVFFNTGQWPGEGGKSVGLVFEASISPHLVAWQNYARSLVVSDAAQSRWYRRNFALVATPGVTLRMFRENSNPVKTPSCWPRVQAQRMTFTKPRPGRTDSSAPDGG